MRLLSIFLIVLMCQNNAYSQTNVTVVYDTSPADSLLQAGNLSAAKKLFPIQISKDSLNVTYIYNYACILAKCREIDSAFKYLNIYVKREPTFFTLQDPDLINLHEYSQWKKIVYEVISSISKNKNVLKNPDLTVQLLHLFAKDQAYQNELSLAEEKTGYNSSIVNVIWDLKEKYNKENQIDLDKIILKTGFPKISNVGKDAAKAAFMVIQHADITRQKKYIAVIKDLCEKKEAEWSSYALLYDRIQVYDNKKQLYGSQLKYNDSTQNYELYPIEDEANVDKRRKEKGLNSLADYVIPFGIFYQPVKK